MLVHLSISSIVSSSLRTDPVRSTAVLDNCTKDQNTPANWICIVVSYILPTYITQTIDDTFKVFFCLIAVGRN